jgi:hypothetical protein
MSAFRIDLSTSRSRFAALAGHRIGGEQAHVVHQLHAAHALQHRVHALVHLAAERPATKKPPTTGWK